jgi:micrococcal nuclease
LPKDSQQTSEEPTATQVIAEAGPTDTPESTETPLPTDTPSPTDTPQPTATPTPAFERVEAQVVEVVDGDTIKVAVDGTVYPVRYIGIDCPETVHPSEPVQWMGPEACQCNRRLVEGQTVYLEKDVSETDQYGRLLRYVFLADGTLVNAELVRLGYAQSVTYPPDVRYQDLFLEMQQEAREAGRGLWGPTPTPVPPTATRPPAPTATQPPVSTATAVPPTQAPEPTPTLPPAPTGPDVRIVAVDKRAEFVDIRNLGDQPQDLGGWVLVSEKGDQACTLGGVINAGETLRIWALAKDAGQGGYNCGFGKNIWNNSESDPAALYDATGKLIHRYP